MKSEEEKLFGHGAFLPVVEDDDEETMPILYDGDEKSDEEEIQDDLKMARKTYRDLLEKSNDAMDVVVHIIEESESPRAVEVLSGLIKSIGDTADKLVDMHGKKVDLRRIKKESAPAGTNVQNNIYVGSTADLQELFHTKKRKGEKVVNDDESES